MTNTPSAMQVDAALVRHLAELLDETKLTEIEVQDGDRKIRVARNLTVAAAAPAAYAAAPAPASALPAALAPAAETAPAAPSGDTVKSPMVGTVYLSAEPGAKPFASVGDTVAEGATLVIIEAMKVMNPITAPRAGTIVQVCVGDKQPVEFDQPLIVIG
jgi:acetyl-CoA carboxylase biotin carboxyl carrier protein